MSQCQGPCWGLTSSTTSSPRDLIGSNYVVRPDVKKFTPKIIIRWSNGREYKPVCWCQGRTRETKMEQGLSTTRWTWGCWRGMRYEGVWDSQPGAGTQPKTDLGNNSNNYITSGLFMRININTIEKHGLNSTSESPINIRPFGDLDMKALFVGGEWECVWCGVNGQLCGGGEEEARDGPAER